MGEKVIVWMQIFCWCFLGYGKNLPVAKPKVQKQERLKIEGQVKRPQLEYTVREPVLSAPYTLPAPDKF